MPLFDVIKTMHGDFYETRKTENAVAERVVMPTEPLAKIAERHKTDSDQVRNAIESALSATGEFTANDIRYRLRADGFNADGINIGATIGAMAARGEIVNTGQRERTTASGGNGRAVFIYRRGRHE